MQLYQIYDICSESYLMLGCLCGEMMSLFFSQTMSGSGFPMALTASSTRVPCFTLRFFSFSVNWGRNSVSLAGKQNI